MRASATVPISANVLSLCTPEELKAYIFQRMQAGLQAEWDKYMAQLEHDMIYGTGVGPQPTGLIKATQ